MKTKQIISLLVGITCVALAPAIQAAGNGGGGGGGFHGGGFGGGGFHGGGVGGFRGGALAAGHVGGGVGSRGVESALVDRTSQVGFRTLPAQDPGSLHLEGPH